MVGAKLSLNARSSRRCRVDSAPTNNAALPLILLSDGGGLGGIDVDATENDTKKS